MADITVEDIQKLCPKAENITITADGTVGMKVGSMAMSENVYRNKNKQEIRNQIVALYRRLVTMNLNLN